jgi:23S rRNA (uracil1939-C5)-methyltransferase
LENPVVGMKAEVQITGLSHDGQGVARLGSHVLFITGALPGELIRARLTYKAKRHWLAEMEAIIQASPERQKPPCILADHCGGCSLQHYSDAGQQHWKQQKVVDALERIAHLKHPVSPLLGCEPSLGYRNRAIIPLERLEDGRIKAGYYRPGSHQIVNMNHCPVLDPRLDALIEPLKADLEASEWPIDRDCKEEGGLRHLALRVGANTGEVLLTLVSSHHHLDGLALQAAHWMARWPQLVGVCLNLQPKPTNVLMGEETRVIAGRSWLLEQFCGLDLRIAADTFFQVNTPQAERVVPLLLNALESLPPGVMVDGYCGIGTYSLPVAASGWQVHGIELSQEAVKQAKANAEANNLSHLATYEAGVVSRCLPEHLVHCDVLFLDPPRKGLDSFVVEAILAKPPQTLIYLSCDPATLARDLGQFTASAYQLEQIQPIDFFPQTIHVETLAVLRRI